MTELTMEIDPVTEQILQEYCKGNGASTSAVVKRAIQEYFSCPDRRQLASDALIMSRTITSHLEGFLEGGTWEAQDLKSLAEILKSLIARMV